MEASMRWCPLVVLVACSSDVKVGEKIALEPAVTITAPGDGDEVGDATAIDFVGAVSDGNGIDDVVRLEWASDLAGVLATEADAPLDNSGTTQLARVLVAGNHAITLTAEDVDGLVGVASISLVVTLGDRLPTAVIDSPAAFREFEPGEDIQLVGTVGDPNQAPSTLGATWSYEPAGGGARSDIEASVPTGGGAVLATWAGAPVGSHRVILTVTDDEGNVAEDDVVIGVTDPSQADLDGDSYSPAQGDCDDLDPDRSPGLDEWCDGKDNDCNGVVDDKDLDTDGHVDEDCAGYTGGLPLDDCDDADGSTFPGAAEIADLADNDCDGLEDEGLTTYDNDGDCFCAAPAGCTGSIAVCATILGGDCDDTDPTIHPDDVDGDGASPCAGDCDDGDPTMYPDDLDGDGSSTCDGDCDDADALLSPADDDADGASGCAGDCDDANALLNLLDSDLDGASTCEGDCNDGSASFNTADLDGDGYSTCRSDCNDYDATLTPLDADGDGASACDLDCDDGDATLNVDDADGDGYSTCDLDCDDGDPLVESADVDGDGWTTCDGDCADVDVLSNPGRLEIAYNGRDDDCSGGDLVDVDGDGQAANVVGGGDCNDGDPQVYAGATERCSTAYDDDCDGTANEENASGCATYYYDGDGDGYGTTSSRCLCAPNAVPSYDALVSTDCYDNNPDAKPGQLQYFYDDRGDGSWDYNCDNVQSKTDNRSAIYDCDLCGFLNFDCCYSDGWLGSAPSCGQTRDYATGCYWIPAIQCDPNSQSPVDQSCR